MSGKGWKELPIEPKPQPRPKKDGVGTVGRFIPLRANYFEVRPQKQDKKLVHYDVVIREPGRGEKDLTLSKARKMIIFETMKAEPELKHLFSKYRLAFDGMKSAVSVNIIPQFKDGCVYKVHVTNNSNRKNLYHVILKVANIVNLSELLKSLQIVPGERKEFPATVFQLIEIMFRHNISNKYISVGQNSFFSMDAAFGDPRYIGSGMDAKQGFFASLRAAQWKDGSLLLNVDVANAVFYKEQTVLEFMMNSNIITEECYRKKNLNGLLDGRQKTKLLEKLKGLKIRVTHLQYRRTYKVIDVMADGADTLNFKKDDKTVQTVKDYFKESYPRTQLLYPKLNVIRAAPENRTIFLPMECCVIDKGQKVKKRQLESKETANFIKFTAQPPSQRLRKINDIVQKNKFSEDLQMKDLGFIFSDKPIELKGRVLPPPQLKVNANHTLSPREGKWDIREKKFYESADINSWGVLNYDNRLGEDIVMPFVNELRQMGNSRGMKISEPQIFKLNWPNPEKDLTKIKEKNEALQLFLVILPTKIGPLYAQVKKIGDREIHVVTQCVLSTNVRKKQAATIGNILFKINAKMGGINNILGNAIGEERLIVLNTPVMIMGADVNHPPANDKNPTPSVAAVVGSVDRHACKYAVQVRHQTARKEMIESLKDMTKELLKTFYRKTNCKPERLIMYRDGVSESQFLEVLAFELRAMRDACTSLEADYKPAITFIVVQKRHHTRFFPVLETDGVGKNKNVPPGTIVDTGVTHPNEMDFFLCSHEGIQGTSKPTHYRVLWDDSDFTVNQLQCFSYAICHLYARCARSVSLPTPAYYAHLAAYRGKIHLQDVCGSDHQSLFYGEEKQALPDNVLQKAVIMDMNNDISGKLYFL